MLGEGSCGFPGPSLRLMGKGHYPGPDSQCGLLGAIRGKHQHTAWRPPWPPSTMSLGFQSHLVSTEAP